MTKLARMRVKIRRMKEARQDKKIRQLELKTNKALREAKRNEALAKAQEKAAKAEAKAAKAQREANAKRIKNNEQRLKYIKKVGKRFLKKLRG